MKCSNCGFENPQNMRFCGMCGSQITKECPTCHSAIPANFKFCGNCGIQLALIENDHSEMAISVKSMEATDASKLIIHPTTSDHTVNSRATKIQLNGKRRLATVLVADVQSSTNLMEQLGTEDWVSIMNKVLHTMADEIYRFGGEVDQFRGDGLIAFFGAWSAHEDDPERAVFAGLLMQMAIQRLANELRNEKGIDLAIRVGINTGEVIAGNIGNMSQHREDTAMGGAVALAARLESIAQPGTVLVSEETYQLTEHLFKWQNLGEISVRGITNPQAVYRPIKPLSEPEQEHRLQEYGLSIPLIGRDKEFDQIQKVIYDLRNGVGGIVMVSGMAGLGKSRLISEVQQSIIREEAISPKGLGKLTWLRGRCRSYGHSLSHSMWIDVIHRWLGMYEWTSQEEVLEKLQQKSRDLWGNEYSYYYPYLAKFLSLPLEKSFSDWVEYLEGEGLRLQIFNAIHSWVEALASQGPIVIIFSETHWADETSLALLKHCLPLSDQVPILWIVVFRPDPDAPTWSFNHFVETEYPHRLTSIDLPPLSKSASADLLGKLLEPGALPEEMTAAIIEKSEGNPYYLSEIVRSLVDRGVISRQPDKGHWELTQMDAGLDLPNTLIGLLSARITRLSTEEQRILQLASVIGSVFWTRLLEVLMDEENIIIEDRLTSLQRARLIRERGSLTELGTEYVFLSALIRDAAYESLLTSSQEKYHLKLAEYLEEFISENALTQYHGSIAYHYHQAGVCKKEIFHSLLAANNAQRVYANAEAIQHFSAALKILDSLANCKNPPTGRLRDEWRLEALTGLGKTYFGIGEISQAEKNLRQAVNLGREIGIEPPSLIRLFYWLGEVLFWQNQYEEPIHLGEEGLYYLGEDNKNIEAALMNQIVAIGCSQLGDHEKFIEFTQRTAGFIQSLPYTEELRPAYDHIIGLFAYTLKDVSEAKRWLALLQNNAENHHDIRAIGEVYNHKAFISSKQGDLKSAAEFYNQAVEKFIQIGDDKHTCRSLRGLGVCYLKNGELNKAERIISSSLEKARTINNQIDLSLGYWFQAQIHLCSGLKEEAAHAFAIAKDLAKDITVIKGGWAFLGLGQVHFSHANASEIIGNYQSTLENDPNLIFRNPYLATSILSNIERSFENPEDFRAYTEDFRRRHPELNHAQFQQWYLTPARISVSDKEPICQESLTKEISHNWQWVDPYKDCSYLFDYGLKINAANERNLHHINRSAPRYIYSEFLNGDFSIQIECQRVSEDQPGIGGLLIWQNNKNWLCLEIGARGERGVIFRGFQDNHDKVFGRGRSREGLISFLRLEKHGYQVEAFCSNDGLTWYFTGKTHILPGEPVQSGFHANGHINRLTYPGAYPEGTAIRFKNVLLVSGA